MNYTKKTSKVIDTATKKYVEALVIIVSNFYKLTPIEVYTKSRKRQVVLIRQIVCYLASKADISDIDIARYIGQDHSNVAHSKKTIIGIMDYDKMLCKNLLQIQEIVRKSNITLNSFADSDIFFTIDLNNFESISDENGSTIILVNCSKEEAKNTLNKADEELTNRVHIETGLYLIELTKNDN